jgi:rubrerythrin
MTHSLFTLIREGYWFCFHCDKIVELGDDTESPAKCPRCKKRTVEWQKPVELNETV